ncbi:MAG TPA: hypothetical protein VND93_30190 [Myxococcales bacterium]|jgi:hypothetical protein|nr:hypothetical protein [Myxococcales bacterium]
MPEPSPKKKPYRPPRVRSERAVLPDLFASGLFKEPDEPGAEPQPPQ